MADGPFGDFGLLRPGQMLFDQRVEMVAGGQLQPALPGKHPPRHRDGSAHAVG